MKNKFVNLGLLFACLLSVCFFSIQSSQAHSYRPNNCRQNTNYYHQRPYYNNARYAVRRPSINTNRYYGQNYYPHYQNQRNYYY